MKIKIKKSKKIKNLLKYILELKNIDYQLSKSHIIVNDNDYLIVKDIYKYLLKNIEKEVIIKTNSRIITADLLPALTIQANITGDFNEKLLTLTATITNIGNSAITQCGFYIYNSLNNIDATTNSNSTPIICTLLDNNTFTTTINQSQMMETPNGYINNINNFSLQIYNFNYQAFATNSNGTSFTNFFTYNYVFQVCLCENTYITLFDEREKYHLEGVSELCNSKEADS